MYKPLEYDPDVDHVEFTRRAAFRAGQLELIHKLKAIMNKQKEGGSYGW